MSDQTPNFFYRLLPNGKGWYWDLVDSKNAVVERGIADERLRARADAFRAAFDRLQPVPKPYPKGGGKIETFRDIGKAAADIDKLVTDLKSAK